MLLPYCSATSRIWPQLVMSLLLGLTLYGCQPAETGQKTADEARQISASDTLLVFGGTVLTMDASTPSVEALLVKDGIIIDRGDHAALAAKMPGATPLDLNGQTLVPGFIDSHVHVRELGMDALKADLVGVNNEAEMVQRLKAKFADPKPGEWLVGQGWDEGKFGSQGYPDRAILDQAYPENPVLLESLHGFASFVNSQALALAGIDASTPDPEVGQILRRDDGTPSGVLLTLAADLVSAEVPAITLQQTKDAILAGLNTLAAAGVTSIHEAGMEPLDVSAYEQLADAGQLPIRVYGMLDGNDEDLMADWFDRGPLVRDDGMLVIRAIKVYYDGSLGSRTALLQAPYSDHPERANPTERITPARVKQLADTAVRRGFQMAVHAIGDEGNNRILDLYEAALAAYPDLDHRWRIEHAQVVLPDYFARVARMGVISSMQPSHAMGDSDWAEDRLGATRIHYAYAWQKILAAGGRLVMNSDLPGEPWTPAETLYFAVNRRKLDGTPLEGWYADQALSKHEALQAMTLSGAHAAFQASLIGSLEVGKAADFVVLAQNPLALADDALDELKVIATYVAGRQVH